MRIPASAYASVLLAFLPHTVVAQNDALVTWAENGLRFTDGARTSPAATVVSDHFGASDYVNQRSAKDGLAEHGRKLPTAGSGSFWVYDTVHHIAAVSEYGDVDGDRIAYLPNPPVALPRRNLSHVVSAHGLHLGSTAADATRILQVPRSAVKRITSHQSMLYARAPRMCGTYKCAHDATIIFTDGRAVSISLADIGP